jgi:hypothetical protein
MLPDKKGGGYMKQTLLRVVGAALCIVLLGLSAEAAKSGPVAKDESLRKGETRQTLDPSLFSDPRVRKAYQIAKDIPWVLDSIYCYCMCKESPAFRHTSLLSCYVDNHAAV